MLLSGNEAVATAALDAGVGLGTGYPGTPSTEILEHFSQIGGRAQWAPNEKVALEVGLGAAFAGADVLVTMKHVGVNVAADPLFTAAYTGVTGGLVLISADDPGMASSQNEQDNRHYARAAKVPMLEPSDSQEAYDFCRLGLEISRRFSLPVILRLTTRICHSKTIVQRSEPSTPQPVEYARDIPTRVMIPAYARGAHKKLAAKLDEVADWNATEGPNRFDPGGGKLGIITSGVACVHAREAAPDAAICKLGMTFPLPIEQIRRFADGCDRVVVIEEGDPVLVGDLRAAGIDVQAAEAMYRFGELTVSRVRRILAGDTTPEPAPPKGKPPQLCPGCPHRNVFEILRDEGCIVAGDIGCYTLGVLPPFEAMDTCVCMGASIGVGLGLRHVLPDDQAAKVVSVIGDSTFAHSGLTGLAEMVYNPPPTGHVVIILDNGTTAMTGLQEHPGTGRKLDHSPTHQVVFEDVARAMGIENVTVMNPSTQTEAFADAVRQALAARELSLIIGRRPCLLAAGKIKQYQAAAGKGQ
jgi:indolepyruvate ferredoxin oxidoreductase alpha subunit